MFRRHVSPGSGWDSRLRGMIAVGLEPGGGTRQSKIEHLSKAIGPHHDVFGLDVAVNNSSFMCGCKRGRNLTADRSHLRNRNSTATNSAKRNAFYELHYDGDRRIGANHLMNDDDIRMI